MIVEERRLLRDMEDLAGIHKRLSFMNIEMIAVHDLALGDDGECRRPAVGQLFREATLAASAAEGHQLADPPAGGKAYGYRPIR